jgi:SAM-dependent methyltransferase
MTGSLLKQGTTKLGWLAMTSATAGYAHKVAEYVAGRPTYPVELLSDLPLADAIMDLGAGTGKFTELLALTGKRIVAVEPLDEMAARIRLNRLPGVEVLTGRAEAIPMPDRSVGLVCCATAFHWFDYRQATAEIIRVLHLGGALALIWNVRDVRVAWVAELSKLFDSYAGDTPRHSAGRWRLVFDDHRFRHVASHHYPHAQSMPARGIVDRVLSTSFIAVLPADEQQVVRTKVAHLIGNTPSLAGKDAVQFPYVTELHLFSLRGAVEACAG